MKTEDELIEEFIELIDKEIEDYDLEPLISEAFKIFRKQVIDTYGYELEEADESDEDYEIEEYYDEE